jgi:hypothetical protein
MAVVRRFDHDDEVTAHGIELIASLCVAGSCDALELELDTTVVVQWILRAMQLYSNNRSLIASGARALPTMLACSTTATTMLKQRGEEVVDVLDRLLSEITNEEVLICLCRVRNAICGGASLLEALKNKRLHGYPQQVALLRTFGAYAEDCDSFDLLRIEAVKQICTAMIVAQSIAPAAISALGRVVEFLIQGESNSCAGDLPTELLISRRSSLNDGTEVIIRRLQVEVESNCPDVDVYTESLHALRNLSRRSIELGSRISQSRAVIVSVDVALDRDYFDLHEGCLSQLLGALSFFGGLPKLFALLEKYPDGPILHQSACHVLIEDAKHQDGATDEGTILHAAASVASYANRVLEELVPKAQFPVPLAAKAVELHGHVLGNVAQRRYPAGDSAAHADHYLIETSINSILRVLKDFPQSAMLASEVCRALTQAVAGHGCTDVILPILAASGAGADLLALVHNFPEDLQVTCDASVAIGILGGLPKISEFMRVASGSHVMQLGGCRAFVELCRLGCRFQTIVERDAALHAVYSAPNAFSKCEHTRLREQVELAAGLVSQAAVHVASHGGG